MHRGVTCRELIDRLHGLLEGELAPSLAARFEGHLAECRDCVAYLDGYRLTVWLARRAWQESDPAPADAPRALVRAILRELPDPNDPIGMA